MLHKDDLTGRHVWHIHKKAPPGLPEGILGETVVSKASPSQNLLDLWCIEHVPTFIIIPRVGQPLSQIINLS